MLVNHRSMVVGQSALAADGSSHGRLMCQAPDRESQPPTHEWPIVIGSAGRPSSEHRWGEREHGGVGTVQAISDRRPALRAHAFAPRRRTHACALGSHRIVLSVSVPVGLWNASLAAGLSLIGVRSTWGTTVRASAAHADHHCSTFSLLLSSAWAPSISGHGRPLHAFAAGCRG